LRTGQNEQEFDAASRFSSLDFLPTGARAR
jgi:hypothetical protein